MQNNEWIKHEIKLVIEKVDRNMIIYGNKFPNVSFSGLYSEQLNEDGSWTGSFWTGMVYLAYKYTGDEKYIEYLRRYLPIYQKRIKEGYKDHDLGFLYQLYSVIMYRKTGEQDFKDLTVDAADELMKRYNPKGKFIRAWGSLDDDYRAGKMIVDCMMNLPLLYSASTLTGDLKYIEAADGHADSTARYNIREDYSVYHTYDFNPETGEPIGGFNEGGYADESCWSRGQAWTIYGFALAYRHTGKKKYIELTQHLIEYFVNNLSEDYIPYWDFKLPDFTDCLRDASAAAIAAAGMFELAEIYQEKNEEKFTSYKKYAMKMLESLKENYSDADDVEKEGILKKCFGRINGSNRHIYSIWGDYYYFECLMRAEGYKTDMWSL